MKLGLFDSGVGGLTSLRAIRHMLPNADLVYLGDTARLPYGTKSSQTVRSYAELAVGYLVQEYGVDAVVVACNTASAYATNSLKAQFPHIPVYSVIEPSVSAAVASLAAVDAPLVGVLATEATVREQSYKRAILASLPHALVVSEAAQLLVALAEEGVLEGKIARLVIEKYLTSLFTQQERWPQVLILGCTHFPILKHEIRRAADGLGANAMHIVDPSLEIASTITAEIGSGLQSGNGETYFLATDNADRFVRVGNIFLRGEIDLTEPEIIDLMPGLVR